MNDMAQTSIELGLKLKPKHKVFADLILANPETPDWQCYSKAYKNNNRRSCEVAASRLLKKAEVHAYISAVKLESAENTGVDREWVVQRFKDISDRCMQAEPVMEFDPIDRCMKPTGEWTFNAGGANKATEMIGRELGMFTAKDNAGDRLVVNLNIDLGNGKAVKTPVTVDAEQAEVAEYTETEPKYAEGREMLSQLGLMKDAS